MLIVLVTVTTLTATLGWWVRDTLFDTEAIADAAAVIPQDPETAQAIGEFVAAEVTEAAEIQARLEGALPEDLTFLSAPLSAGIELVAAEATARIINSDEFVTLWRNAVAVAHRAAVVLIEGGENDVLVSEEGVVFIDLTPLIVGVVEQIGDAVPDVTADGPVANFFDLDPAAARAELESRLGIALDEGFGQIVVFESESLAAAQTYIDLLETFVWISAIVWIVAVVAALWLSRHRRRTLIHMAVAVGVGLLITAVLMRAVRNATLEALTQLPADGAQDALASLFSGLNRIILLTVVAAIVVAVAAWLSGDSRIARRVQSELGRIVAAGRERVDEREGSSFLGWVGRTKGPLQVLGIVLAFAVLFVADTITVLGLLIVLAVLGLYLLLLAIVPAPETESSDVRVD